MKTRQRTNVIFLQPKTSWSFLGSLLASTFSYSGRGCLGTRPTHSWPVFTYRVTHSWHKQHIHVCHEAWHPQLAHSCVCDISMDKQWRTNLFWMSLVRSCSSGGSSPACRHSWIPGSTQLELHLQPVLRSSRCPSCIWPVHDKVFLNISLFSPLSLLLGALTHTCDTSSVWSTWHTQLWWSLVSLQEIRMWRVWKIEQPRKCPRSKVVFSWSGKRCFPEAELEDGEAQKETRTKTADICWAISPSACIQTHLSFQQQKNSC